MKQVSSLINKILAPKKVVGLEVEIRQSGSYIFNVVELSVVKDFLNIDNTHSNIPSWSDLWEILPANIPVSLCIHGWGVINKVVSDGSTNALEALPQILPNINPNDVYLDTLRFNEHQQTISVVRKQALDDIIEAFTKQKVPVFNLSLGPFMLKKLIPFFEKENQTDTTIKANKYELIFETDELKTFNENSPLENSSALIGSQEISTNLLLAFSAGFSLITGTSSIIKQEELIFNKKEWQYKKLLKPMILAASFILVIMIFGGSYYSDQWQTERGRLIMKTGNKQVNLRTLEKLEMELEQNGNYIKKAGWLNPSVASYYADRLALSTPTTVKWEKASIYPPKKKTRTADGNYNYEFSPKKITIEGYLTESVSFNEWISTLKNEKWIKEVVIDKYEQKGINQSADFVIEITTI